jgi:hypothetical protein
MAANTLPIYTRLPDIQFATLTATSSPAVGATANTSLILAASTLGTDVFAVFTADATNGGYCQRIRFKPATSATITILTAARVFINNGGTPATLGTSFFYDDITLPAVTPAINAASPAFELSVNMALPAGYRLLVAFATAQTTGLWQVSSIGGKY